MEQSKKGGKRVGAGRKPSGIRKKTITFYVEEGKIYKFGNEEKLKKEVYLFIGNYGLQDLSKPTNEIKPHEQPKTNYFVDTTPKITDPLMVRKSLQQWILEKKTIDNEDVYRKWLQELEATDYLTDGQKAVIKKS